MEDMKKELKDIYAQAVVVGAGAGGFGAAYTLAKQKIKTVLIEKNPGLGGTAVYGGVNCWEPGVATGELHQLIRKRLQAIPGACAVCKTVDNSLLLEPEKKPSTDDRKQYPWGLSVTAEESVYEDTLKRCPALVEKSNMRRFLFEPRAMEQVLNELLAECGDFITVFTETRFVACETEGRAMKSVTVQNAEGQWKIYADYFVDSTGDIVLAREAGCEVTIGRESRDQYGEPSAGEKDDMAINGVSYVFRIRKSEDPEHVDPYVPDQRAISRRVSACFNQYTNGEINVNMLPTLLGREYLAFGDQAEEVGRATALDYWNRLQLQHGMKGYELMYFFPMTGVRESYRLVGKYVLTEHDLMAGTEEDALRGEIATIADHPRDRHGEAGGCADVPGPYGIPISCTEAKEFDNLFVACRGASFSSVAAASARLTRTMLGLGEAVGRAIAKRLQ